MVKLQNIIRDGVESVEILETSGCMIQGVLLCFDFFDWFSPVSKFGLPFLVTPPTINGHVSTSIFFFFFTFRTRFSC
jgi:hypothetical protein